MLTLQRREFLKITAVAGALLAGGGIYGERWLGSRPIEVHETRILMGTVLTITVFAPSEAAGHHAVRAALDEMARLVAIFDHRIPTTALAQLNRSGGLPNSPVELWEVMKQSVRYGDLTAGAFDVTIKPVLDALRTGRSPAKAKRLVDYRKIRMMGSRVELDQPGMAVTLDGIAKGYIVDKGVEVLKSLGYSDVLVDAGGDLMCLGSTPARSWRIGVQDPRPERSPSLLTTFELRPGAAATSGDYQNAFTADRAVYHIINPASGASPSELASATVLAPRARDADALSTSVMVLGAERGLLLVEQLPGIEALVVTKDKRIRRTSGFPAA
jgi:thiamine biosynthesis lipoprotein